MKYSIKHLLFLTAGILMLAACKKVENKIMFQGGTTPVLTASMPVNSVIPLDGKTKDAPAIKLNWTNPDYKLNTGVSSQNVNYTIQIDKSGAGFSSSKLQEKSFTGDLGTALTQGDLNKMLILLGFPFDEEATFEMRLKSYLGDGSVPLYSNVLTYKAVPFLDVVVPIPTTGELWIVGSATATDWNNPTNDGQKLTRTNLTTWEITIQLIGGQEYLLIPVNGQWNKYSVKDNKVSDLWQGGSFGQEQSDNFPGPPTSGLYKIVVDFVLGKFTVTPQ